MTQAPLVSLCIPLFNKVKFVEKTLEAVLQQTYPNLEVVLSDNGSNDGSEVIAQEFARRDPRIKYHRLQHTVSITESWRYCYLLAQGEFVNLHSADDHTLQPDFLQRMIDPMLKRPEIGFTVCEIRAVFSYISPGLSGDGLVNFFRAIAAYCRELTNISDRDARARKLLERASLENLLGTPYAVVCRRSCLPFTHWKKTAVSWPESYVDWDFLIRLFLDHRGEFVDGPTFTYHYDAGSPYWRHFVDNRPDLFDKMCRMLMPFTILADPQMADLRLCASPEDLKLLTQHFYQRFGMLTEIADQVIAYDRPQFTTKIMPQLAQLSDAFRRQPNEFGSITRLRQLRNGLVRHWLSASPDQVVQEYMGPHGQAHRLFCESGIRRFPRDEYEQGLVDETVASLTAKQFSSESGGEWLALMLLSDLRQIPGFQHGQLPAWLRADYERLG